MEWNPKLCISPPILKMNKRSRGSEQVLAMATSPGNRSVEDKDGFICSPKAHHLYSASALDSQDELTAEDALDSPCTHAEKKRRLTGEQVEFLESSFEKEYKLEPERKAAIAKQLGLQPRQVAVWFQNRRARWKTKQLEIDYSSLKADYDTIVNENQKLHAEVSHLRCQLKETITHASKSDEHQQLSNESPCSVFHSKAEEEEEEVDSTKFPHYLHVVCLQQPKQELTPSCVGGVEDISSSQSKSDNNSNVLESSLIPLNTGAPPPNPLVSLVLQETTTLVHVDMDSTPPLSVYSTCEDLFPNPYLFNPYIFQQYGMKVEGANISGLFSDDGSSTNHLIFSCDDDTNVYHHNHPPYD